MESKAWHAANIFSANTSIISPGTVPWSRAGSWTLEARIKLVKLSTKVENSIRMRSSLEVIAAMITA